MGGTYGRMWRSKMALRCGTAAFALASLGNAAAAEPGTPAPSTVAVAPDTASVAPIEETSRYPMRLMTQVFDGTREFSHTQVAGFARMRRGDESWVVVNFGDGAVQIDSDASTAAGAFRNTSGSEIAMRYDYATKTLDSSGAGLVNFHNAFVRPLLGNGPALGADARWTAPLTLAQLGLPTLGDQTLSLELSREYFSHGGRQFVLVHYRVPAFTYQSDGRAIVQWAEGAALTDPGFGQMYWSASLARAVADQGGTSGRPYRIAKSMTALAPNGAPMIELRAIPQLAPHLARFNGPAEAAVANFDDAGRGADQIPLALAANIDITALSLAEDSANQLGELSDTYLQGQRGNEIGSPSTAASALPTSMSGRPAGTTLSPAQTAALNALPTTMAGRPAESGLSEVQLDAARAALTSPSSPAASGLSQAQLDAARAALTSPNGPAASGLSQAQLDAARAAFASPTGAAASGLSQAQLDAARAAFASPTGAAASGLSQAQLDAARAAFASPTGAAASGLSQAQLDAARAALTSPSGPAASGLSQAQLDAARAVLTSPSGPAASGLSQAQLDAARAALTLPTGPTLTQQFQAVKSSAADFLANNPVPSTIDTSDKVVSLTEGILKVMTETAAVVTRLNAADAEVTAISSALKAALAVDPGELVISPAYLALKAATEAQLAEIRSFEVLLDVKGNFLPRVSVQLALEYDRLIDGYQASLKSLQAAAESSLSFRDSSKIALLEAQYGHATGEMARLVEESGRLGKTAETIGRAVKALKVEEVAAVLKRITDSPAGKLVSKAATVLDVITSATAVNNVRSAMTSDQGSGALALTRDYGDGVGRWGVLALEIGALYGAAATGNVPSFAAGASALTLGSVGDIAIATKGLYDVSKQVAAAKAETARLEAQLAQMKQEKAFQARLQPKLDAIDKDFTDFKAEIAQKDKVVADLGNEMLRQIAERRSARQAAEAAAEREAQAELARQVAEAKRQNELEYQRNLKRPPTAAEWAKFDKDIAEAMKPDYPTAPALTLAEATARIAATKLKARLAAERAAAELADREAAQLAAIEAVKAARRAADEKSVADASDAIARRAYQDALDRARRDARGKALEVSSLDIEPVTFNPPVWTPPVFKPPVWVPPKFDAPETSRIDWTNFDDDDYPGANANLAFQYESMSGKVATDLSKYSEWLATQDVRLLTRLALQAGYPNLASALADSQNLIAQSQDTGYRRWALQQPSCGGYVGCGPSFLERWTMKQSVVALGDLLADSRGITSSGGFSDVGISGLNLEYLLRDFAVQDGDIVQIKINQFGKVIYSGRLSLTNAGNAFAIALRRGVAVLEIFAENEGTSSPNTAELKLNNVVRGQATQNYSLNTGETATLRINSGEGR